MNTTANGPAGREAAAIHPKLSAEQALLRLLELIRSSQSIADFTPERLSQVMGIDMKLYGPDHYGFGEQLTPQWWYGLEMKRTIYGPRFEFSFNEENRVSDPPMTDICQIDLNRFAKELEAMEFTRETSYGSHGSLGYEQFDRSRLTIKVYPRGEANEPTDKISHLCIQSVVIR